MLPDHLSFYKINKKIGKGSFSKIYLATHTTTQQKVAIKCVSTASLKPACKNLLIQEIKMLKSLDHPHIIKLYETFEDPKRIFVVTDICKGGELFDEI